MLTSYNGTTISYDAIGNPTNWHNAQSFTWDGRKLTNHAVSSNENLQYSYDSSGIRTRKYYINYSTYTLNDHTYVLDGTNIIKETIQSNVIGAPSTDVLYYYYDETGVAGFEYNGTNYYFLKNIQGDVINILNSSGQVVVTYSYDAWGKVLSVTGSQASTVGQINPFRYRGYYYDTETGFYYLQTRYYDPTVGRFLNADGYVSTGQGIIGNNMFAYCSNNPVAFADYNGQGLFYNGEAHKAVLDDIYKNYGTTAEGWYVVSVDSKISKSIKLRPDIVDNTGGVYELKPISYAVLYRLRSMFNQVFNYINLLNDNIHSGYHLGTHQMNGITVTASGYIVVYSTIPDIDGAVFYAYADSESLARIALLKSIEKIKINWPNIKKTNASTSSGFGVGPIAVTDIVDAAVIAGGATAAYAFFSAAAGAMPSLGFTGRYEYVTE